MDKPDTPNREQWASAIEDAEQVMLRWGHGQVRRVPDEIVEAIVAALKAPRSEQQPSVPVKDMEIIGHREPGDAHKGRAWWSGGTWLQPGEVVAVLTLPKQDERHSQ